MTEVGNHDGSAPADTDNVTAPGGSPAVDRKPTSLLGRALLVVVSVVVAAVILTVAAWLTADRLPSSGQGDAGWPARPRAGVQQGRGGLGEVELPEGSQRVPRSFVGEPKTSDKLIFASVPGHLATVREYFVRQASEKQWRCIQRPVTPGSRSTTLLIENAGAARMITILEAPSGQECTVGIYDLEGP